MNIRTLSMALGATLLTAGAALAAIPSGEFGARQALRQRTARTSSLAAPAQGKLRMPLPRKADAAFPSQLYGSVVYSNLNAEGTAGVTPLGLYRVADTDGTLEMEVPDLNAFMGGVLAGNTYYAVYQTFDGTFVKDFIDAYSFNPDAADAAGRWDKLWTHDATGNMLATGDLAFNPLTGRIYGCFSDEFGQYSEFGILDPEAGTRSLICQLPVGWEGCAFDDEGTLYAVDVNGNLCTVDLETGQQNMIGATGVISPYPGTSAVIDPKTGVMYLSKSNDEGGYLYSVDLATAQATEVCLFPENEELAGLAIPLGISNKTPNPVENLSVAFPDGGFTGTATFTAPLRTIDGKKGEGALAYTVYMDGVAYATGNCNWGENVTVDNIQVFVSQNHEFTATVSADGNESYNRSVKVWIGSDTPQAPAVSVEREGTVNHLSWTLPATGVHGGYVDAAATTYKVVRYPDNAVLAEAAAGTTLDDTVPDTDKIVDYTYGVLATYDDWTSAEGRSDAVTVGYIVPPYEQNFDSRDDFATMTVINANDDFFLWKWWDMDGGIARINWTSMHPMDDYLVLPRLYLQKGNAYALSFKVNAEKANKPERIEVLMGTECAPEGFTTTLLAPTTVRRMDEYQTMRALIVPEADGYYYVAFHGISDPDRYYLKLDDITIDAAQNAGLPAAPSAVAVTPAYDGSLSAEIAFTAPATACDGSALSGLTALTILRDGQFAGSIDNPEPGKAYTYTDTQVPALGYHYYTVIPENSFGEGAPVIKLVYVGANIPTSTTNVKAVESSEGTVTITWDAPAVDVDGQPMNPALLSYVVVDASDTQAPVVLASDVKETTWSKALVESGKQDLLRFAVFALTSAGQASADVTPWLVVGTPYALPFTETCPSGALDHPMETALENPDKPASWGKWTEDDTDYAVTSANDDMGFLGLQATVQGSEGTVWTGKIAIPADATDAKLTFYDWNWYNPETQAANENLMQVKVRLDDGTEDAVKDVYTTDYEKKNAWMPVEVELGKYAGKTVRVGFRGVCNSYALMFLDDIKLASPSWVRTLGTDQAVAVRGLKGAIEVSAPAGTPLTVVAASGAVMHAAPALGTQTIALPAGIYMVRAAGTTAKVIVK